MERGIIMTVVNINRYFAFIRLTQKFRSVVRDVRVEEKRFENDMEHSYQLAMFGWFLVSCAKLNFDVNKIIKYSLVHDLVETYAGDTPALTSTEKVKRSKFSREEKAFKKIMDKFPEFSELKNIWEKYENREDRESRLVYVIDKVMPVLNEAQQNSGFYKRNNITLKKWKSWLQTKLDQVSYQELNDAGFIKSLLDYLTKDDQRLFQPNQEIIGDNDK
jgi:putative hydrolases of HD superfamily